jgi:hypothetical protein
MQTASPEPLSPKPRQPKSRGTQDLVVGTQTWRHGLVLGTS